MNTRLCSVSAAVSVALPLFLALAGSAALMPFARADDAGTNAPPALSLTLLSSVRAGDSAPATVSSSAGAGAAVTLSSDNPELAAVPDSLAVPADPQGARFLVQTYPVAQPTTIHITAGSTAGTQTAALTLQPPSVTHIDLTPFSWAANSGGPGVTGGGLGYGIVWIDHPAGPYGALVALASNVLGAVPATVLVPPGMTGASFVIATQPVTEQQTLVVTAPYGGLRADGSPQGQAGIPLLPIGLQYITVDTPRLNPGDSTEGTVTLNGPAPAGGASILFTGTNPNIWPPMFQLTVPAGSRSVRFSVKILPGATDSSAPYSVLAEYAGIRGQVNLNLLAPPAAPSGLTALVIPATTIGPRVKLTWTDNSNNEDEFAIWRRSPTSGWTRIGVVPPNTTTFLDTTISPDSPYYYQVRATTAHYASDWSNEAGIGLPPAPQTPTGLSAQAASAREIDLTWSGQSYNTRAFAIWRRSGDGDWQRVGVVPPSTMTFADHTVSPGTTYTYRVRATNDYWPSDWTSEVTATPSP